MRVHVTGKICSYTAGFKISPVVYSRDFLCNYPLVPTGGIFGFFLRNEKILSIIKPSKRQFKNIPEKRNVTLRSRPAIQNINANAQLNTKNDLAIIFQIKPMSGLESTTAHEAIILINVSSPTANEETMNIRKLKFFIYLA
ncbi:MAG: hypothetical protein Q8941_23055 [Bacteroidota bacterium]|nr:hypothetical protein [Bacteroidota bacterium]